MPNSNDHEKGRNNVTANRRQSDKLSSKLRTVLVKALHILIVIGSLTASYFLFWDYSVWGIIMSIICCIPAGMALAELFPGKWKGHGD